MKNISNKIGFAMGTAHAIFSSSDGVLYGIGKNSYGQLGIGDPIEVSTPVRIELDNVNMYDCAREYSVFVTLDGDVYVSGHHTFLTGSWTESRTPVKIEEGCIGCCTNGETLFLLTNTGTVKAAGPNYYYEMGRNEQINRWSIVPVNRATEIRDIAAGPFGTIFLKTNNTVYSCGYNANGELGLGNTTTAKVPTLAPIQNVAQISLYNEHSLFLKADGTVYSSGINEDGRLGIGNTTNVSTPTLCSITNVVDISAGFNHSVFLKADGTVYTCGNNEEGQLGIGTNENANVPTLVPNMTDVKGIYAGDYFTAFLRDDGLYFAGYVPFG